MKDKSFRIGIAAFIGAVIGFLISTQFDPTWLMLPLGTIAGFIVGFISYNFRRSFVAIPQGFRIATETVNKMPKRSIPGEIEPFVFSAIPTGLFLLLITKSVNPQEINSHNTVGVIVFYFFVFVLYTLFTVTLINTRLNFIGTRHSRFEFWKLLFITIPVYLAKKAAMVAWVVIKFVFCIFWKWLGLGIWHTIKYIYTHMAVLTGLSAATGVVLGYFLLAPHAESFAGMILATIATGLTGGATGVAQYKLVSKIQNLATNAG